MEPTTPITTISRDEILALIELPWEKVDLPGGKAVIVQGMTGTERDAFEASLVKRDGRRNLGNVRARLAIKCIVDKPGGQRLFRENDVDKLGLIRVDVLQKVYAASQRVNGFSDEDVDELEQASAAAAGSGSSSSSPSS